MRLGAIPFDELIHRMSVAGLGFGRREAIENSGLRLIVVSNRRTALGMCLGRLKRFLDNVLRPPGP